MSKKDKNKPKSKEPIVITRALVGGDVVIQTKPLRDAKGHFISRKSIDDIQTGEKPVKPKLPERDSKGHFISNKPKATAKPEKIDISSVSYKTVKNQSTGKTYTIGTPKTVGKPIKSLWNAPERVKLWRYTLKGVTLFKFSEVAPIEDRDVCEIIFTSYDTNHDVLALKRAIRQYEESKE
jgi:hypothetical protein